MRRPRGPAGRAPARPSTRNARSRPAPVVSELEVALQRAAAEPSPPPAPFAELDLPPRLVDALERAGRTTAFEIQARVLPDALAGRPVLGRARTGSGKTLAFALPIVTRLAAANRRRRPGMVRGLVLVPTRELAGQVVDTIEPLGRALGLRTLAVYGGASMGRQIEALRRGVDIVVATPGRLADLVERNAASLAAVEITVLDEADHLADLGFLPAVTALLDQTPPDGQRLLFSATLDRDVDTLIRRYLPDPAIHAVAEEAPTGQVEHRSVRVSPTDKVAVAAAIAAEPGRTLVFVRTKHGSDRLARQLARVGVPAAALHGDLRQNQRERALDGFSRGKTPVLVATDVAARGIHVDAVERVLHFDPPAEPKAHLHRSGRTGRAGADGTVVTLVLPDQVREVERLHRAAGTPAEMMTVVPHDMNVVTPVPAPEPEVRREKPAASPRSGRRFDGPRRGGTPSRGSSASGRSRSEVRPRRPRTAA